MICRTGSHFQLSCHKTNGEFSIYPFVIRSASHQNQKLLTFFFCQALSFIWKTQSIDVKGFNIFSQFDDIPVMLSHLFLCVFTLTFKRNYLYRAVILCSIWTINENPLRLSMPSQSACLYGLFLNCYPQAVLGLQPLTKQIRI